MHLYRLVAAIFIILAMTPLATAITQETSTTVFGDTVVKFSGTGSMNFTTPAGALTWKYLIVGGGGSGGSGLGGGGGGGGVLYCSSFAAEPAGEYIITIGAGGTTVTNAHGVKGGNSSIVNNTISLQASGGGYGGNDSVAGGAGGSGGGAGGSINQATEIAGGANVSGQGYPGGYRPSSISDWWYYPSGSGGGAGGAGVNASGIGYTLSAPNGFGSAISGSGYWYGAGGGASSEHWGQNGGYTGGGNGGVLANAPYVGATDGLDGYGAGGGGAGQSNEPSGDGGDGVIYISYVPVATEWQFTEAGTTQYWICPDYVNKIYIQMVGAGGSGRAAQTFITRGLGGDAGEYSSYYGVAVTPGENYTIVVGRGGATSPVGTTSNNGTLSSFTPPTGSAYSVAGGPGGTLYVPNSQGNGGDGEAGFINTTKYSSDGGAAGAYTGGIGGLGYGAGGGGGAYHYTTVSNQGGGGAGSNGTVKIVMMEYSTGNTPAFTVFPTTASVGDLITFTDNSQIRNNLNITYNWSFGDGEYSTVNGNVNHVYGLYGIYTVGLTLTSDSGSGSEVKTNHVTISTAQAQIFPTPRTVTFVCTDFVGNPIENLYITAVPLNFTMPSDWLSSYYGISPTVNMSSSTLAGYTGSDGSWSAPMASSLQYRMTFSGAGVTGYNQTIYPSQTEYYVRIPDAAYAVPTPASNYISYTFGNNTVDSATERYTLVYQDTSGGTSGVTLTVKNSTGVVLSTKTVYGMGTSSTTITSDPIVHSPGDTTVVSMSAEQSRLGHVNKSYTVTWEGLKTMSMFPDWVGQWMGIALLVILAGTFGIISVKFALVIVPALAWFMTYYMRWLQPQIGVSTMVICITILFAFGVLRYMRDSKKKLAGV